MRVKCFAQKSNLHAPLGAHLAHMLQPVGYNTRSKTHPAAGRVFCQGGACGRNLQETKTPLLKEISLSGCALFPS